MTEQDASPAVIKQIGTALESLLLAGTQATCLHTWVPRHKASTCALCGATVAF